MSDYETTVEVDVERLEPEVIMVQTLSPSPRSNEPDAEESGHRCQYCDKLYKTASTLQAHFALKHPEDEARVMCTVCDKSYPSLLSFQKHMRYKHRYNINCKVCYRSFATQESLEYHESWCRKEDTPCSICEKVFTSDLSLRSHMKYKHPAEYYQHQCSVCRRSFSSSRGLSNHMGCVHRAPSERCPQCGRPCSSPATLHTHILNRHTESGFRCSPCPGGFKFISELKRQVHQDCNGEQPSYVCAICKEIFDSSQTIVDHVIIAHDKRTSAQKVKE